MQLGKGLGCYLKKGITGNIILLLITSILIMLCLGEGGGFIITQVEKKTGEQMAIRMGKE